MSYFFAFAGFAALILLHEIGHFIAAKAVGMRVERFSLFFPPLLVRARRGETEYAVGAIPLGGYVKISGMSPQEKLPDEVMPRTYYRQPVWKRVVVIAAGPAMNVLTALVLLFGFYLFAEEARPAIPVVGSVEKDLPAHGRLKPGDRILSIDGRTGKPNDFREQIRTHRCAGEQASGCTAKKPTVLEIERDGRSLTLKIRPEYVDSKDSPGPRLGFRFKRQSSGVGVVKSAGYSVESAWFITRQTFGAVARIFVPEKRKEVSGVVGAYSATEKSISSFGVGQAVLVLAVISLSLAIINLFPFLPLDGGHIFFSLMEKARGKAVSFEAMERAGVIGFMLVIVLFLVGLTNDIGRLTSGEGFGPR